jgi:hypothetical protein
VPVGAGVADGVSLAIEVGDCMPLGWDAGNGVWVGTGVDGGPLVMVGAAAAGGVPVGFGVGDNISALPEVADGVEIDGSTALDAGVSVGVPVVIGATVRARTGREVGVGGALNLLKIRKKMAENKRRSAIHTIARIVPSPSASVPLIFGFIDNSP